MGPVESLTKHPTWTLLDEAWAVEKGRIASAHESALDSAPTVERAVLETFMLAGERRGFERALRVISNLVRAERRAEEAAVQRKESPTHAART